MEEVIGSIPLGSTIRPFDHHTHQAPADHRLLRVRGLAVGVALAALVPVSMRTAPAESLPVAGRAQGTFHDETDILIASLRARILGAHSATLALEGWCAEHHLAPAPRLVAVRLPVADKPLSAAQRARLAIGPDEPVRYRRVRLACGERVLSEADNWYVPARLTPAMNAALDTTRTPFGRVVRPLDPVRRTIEQRTLAVPARPGSDDRLFEIDALLTTGAGEPFCEVAETYLGGALPATPR